MSAASMIRRRKNPVLAYFSKNACKAKLRRKKVNRVVDFNNNTILTIIQ